MSKEAMKLAWEAEEKANPQTRYNSWCRGYEAALREELAKPDFWEGYVPEPVKPAQQCKWPTCQSEEYQQALAEQIKRELVGEQPAHQESETVRAAWMAGYTEGERDALENAQPVQQEPVGRLESDPDEGHVFVPRIDGDWSMLGEDLYTSPQAQRKPIDLSSAIQYADARWSGVDVPIEWCRHFAEALAEQPAQDVPEVGFGNTALDKKAENARELGLDYEPAQQEPVATITITQRGPIRIIDNNFDDCVRGWPDGEYKLYTSQPAQQEPVAAECNFVGTKEWGRCSIEHHNLVQSEPHNWSGYQTRLLYTSPPAQRTWQGLTDEERDDLLDTYITAEGRARAIEAKLRSKNEDRN